MVFAKNIQLEGGAYIENLFLESIKAAGAATVGQVATVTASGVIGFQDAFLKGVINIDGSGNIGFGTNSFLGRYTFQRNINSPVTAIFSNRTDGNNSSVSVMLENGSYGFQLNHYHNLYVASASAIPNSSRVYSDGAGGLSVVSVNNALRFWTGNVETEKARITPAGFFGVGTISPKSKVSVANGDIEAETAGTGVVLSSPNGTRFRLTVSNAGGAIFTQI